MFGIFPVFDNIFTANILGMRVKRRGFPPPFDAGVFLLLSQYRNGLFQKKNRGVEDILF